MANFYTLEEVASKLGVSQDDVKQMADSGTLQQFRDGSQVKFKAEEVDAMMGGDSEGSALPLAGDSGEISLSDSNAIDAISLSDSLGGTGLGDSASGGTANLGLDSGATDSLGDSAKTTVDKDANQATGISVFDAGEVDQADPMAQTVVSHQHGGDDEDLTLESVGSGSGLLDLTRESDDTSLGAELLDEIYPSGGDAQDTRLETSVGSSGVFDGAMTAGATATATVEMPGQMLDQELAGASPMRSGAYAVPTEPSDPAGSAMGAGMLMGATAVLIVAFIIAASAVTGVPNSITAFLSESTNTLMMYSGIALAVCLLLGLVGFFIGKSMDR